MKEKREGLLHKGDTTKWGGYHENMKETEEVVTAWQGEGTSIFDPVLTEICYQWFCTKSGTIIDPFAGGSVRGIVAAKLGFNYIGIDLREEQIKANRAQAETLCDEIKPTWQIGNSLNIDKLCKGAEADLIFSCPPYFDLEVYSDDPEDISTMDWEKFLITYRKIIKKSCELLKPDRFAVFVVANIRDKKGFYRNFVNETIIAFETENARFYNDIILVNVMGSLPIRTGRMFNSGRKVGKCHQNVLVFYKGDPKKIKENFGELDFSKLESETTENGSDTI